MPTISKDEYIRNITVMKNGLEALREKLAESTSYQGSFEIQKQHTADLKYVSDKHAYTALIWSAGIALGGLILFQLAPLVNE
jgi:hypothetical protein